MARNPFETLITEGKKTPKALGLAAIGFGLIESIGQNAIAKASARYSKSVSDYEVTKYKYNAQMVDYEIRDLMRRTNKNVENYEKEINKVVGSQKATLANRGISLDSDIAKEFDAETRLNGALDIETIRNNAWKEAFGLKNKKLDMENRARLEQITGKTQYNMARQNAGIELIGGIVKAATAGGKLFGKDIYNALTPEQEANLKKLDELSDVSKKLSPQRQTRYSRKTFINKVGEGRGGVTIGSGVHIPLGGGR